MAAESHFKNLLLQAVNENENMIECSILAQHGRDNCWKAIWLTRMEFAGKRLHLMFVMLLPKILVFSNMYDLNLSETRVLPIIVLAASVLYVIVAFLFYNNLAAPLF